MVSQFCMTRLAFNRKVFKRAKDNIETGYYKTKRATNYSAAYIKLIFLQWTYLQS